LIELKCRSEIFVYRMATSKAGLHFSRDALWSFIQKRVTSETLICCNEKRAMSDHQTPHFHNDPGVPMVEIGAREFMCIGATPPQDHPHIYLDMGSEPEIVCSYCSTLFRYNPALHANEAKPAICIWHDTPALS
jgi:uncharacterized Zn-finger protein